MSKAVHVHVGDSLDAIGKRIVDAWHRAERGELTADSAEIHIGFETWETMVRTLSPKRLELLRHVHRTPAKSIRALALALNRDYRLRRSPAQGARGRRGPAGPRRGRVAGGI